MVFSSMTFLFLFMPLTLIIYYISPKMLKNPVLVIASLIFYAWGEPRYVFLMLFSTVFDYFNGLGIEKLQNNGKSGKSILCISIIGNLALLGFFKYFDFAAGTINKIVSGNISMLHLALPIGISFYTFQTMSYTIDVYRRKTAAQHNIVNFAAYVTMFPQLIAGPIVRYMTISKELSEREINLNRIGLGMQRFIIGLGKKVILANQAGYVWSEISGMDSPVAATALLGTLFFTFQIYFDFSGYSDMAIGLGQMLGFSFPENFNYPYMASSITDFWRRWHMTLGTWFREYVYIPLGGNQRGMLIQLRNILIVWALTGLWHGAAWTFICWGLYYGFVLTLEKLFILNWLDMLPARFRWFRHIYTIPVFVFGWIIFSADSFSSLRSFLSSLTGAAGWFDSYSLFLLSCWCPVMLVMALGCTNLPAKIGAAFLQRLPALSKTIVCNLYLLGIFVLSLAFLVGDSYNPFLYFRF